MKKKNYVAAAPTIITDRVITDSTLQSLNRTIFLFLSDDDRELAHTYFNEAQKILREVERELQKWDGIVTNLPSSTNDEERKEFIVSLNGKLMLTALFRLLHFLEALQRVQGIIKSTFALVTSKQNDEKHGRFLTQF